MHTKPHAAATLVSAILVLVLSALCRAAESDPDLTPAEKANVTQAARTVRQACLRREVPVSISGGAYAFIYDHAAECDCAEKEVYSRLTATVVRMGTAKEGAEVPRQIQVLCRKREFVKSFAQNCAALAGKTSHPLVAPLKPAAIRSLCECTTASLNEMPADEVDAAAETAFALIDDARTNKRASGVNLDTLLLDEELEPCGYSPDADLDELLKAPVRGK
jgi:hypothetical protein